MVEVVVEYSYEAEQPDELSIKPGDVIKNVLMVDGGWWEGELNGKKGMFPDNFVKVVKNTEEVEKRDDSKKKQVQASKRQSVKDLANKIKDSVHEGPPLMRRKVSEPGAKKKRAKVIFSYEPENEDELKLAVGDPIDILKQEEDGWWEGVLNGKQGMFPSNFVEIADESESAEQEKSEPAEEENLIKGKKVQGIGLGNIFGDGPIKLRSTTGKKPGDKPQEPPKTEKRTEASVRRIKDTKPVEKAVVRYSYVAENEDELSLTEGEVVTVLEKELEDSGWWRGELNGKTGVFPDNFVELMKEEPKPKKPPPPMQPPASAKPLPKLPDTAPAAEPRPEPAREPTSGSSFEAVEPAGDKLTHLTATRPRGPPKRPPSQPKSSDKQIIVKEEERNGDVKDSHWLKDSKSGSHAPHSAPHSAAHPAQHAIPEKKEEVHNREKPHSAPARPPDPSPAPSQVPSNILSALEDLKKDLHDLKTNTVSKSQFNELKAENENLKTELETVKSSYSRRLKDIMAEVDEEKKIRLSTQVEIERIRKLVAESHV